MTVLVTCSGESVEPCEAASFNFSGTANGLSDLTDRLLQIWGLGDGWLDAGAGDVLEVLEDGSGLVGAVGLVSSLAGGAGGPSFCWLVRGAPGCCWLPSAACIILFEIGVGRENGDTMVVTTESFGGSLGGEASTKECFVAAVSTE